MSSIDAIIASFPPELAVLLVAGLPVVELRGALPVGLALGLHPAWAFTLSVLGNMLPVPLVFLLLDPVTRRLMSLPRVSAWIATYLDRTRKKSGQIRKYGFWGLVVFVGVPLPGTGAWTGAIAASLLGLKFGQSMLALFLGTVLAGIAVLVLCLLGYVTFVS
jgi:uncharacterized membrane protein